MKLTKVKELPRGRTRTNNDVMELVQRFVDGKDNICRIDLFENEYKDAYTAAHGIARSIKRLGVEKTVKVCVRNKQVYIFRTEI